MTQDLTIPTGQITADRADRMTAWWPRLPLSQIETRTDRDQISASITVLRKPCDPAWLMARVMALLMPYFTSDVPQGVREIEAEDWLVALKDRPMWAIEKACRWWKGDENPDHRRKPIEGDIARRVTFEMGILTFGAMKIREYDAGHAMRMTEPERKAPTPGEMAQRREHASRIMANCGYSTTANNRGPRRETVTDDDRAEIAGLMARHQA